MITFSSLRNIFNEEKISSCEIAGKIETMQILASRGDVNVWVSDRNHDDEFRSLELNYIYVVCQLFVTFPFLTFNLPHIVFFRKGGMKFSKEDHVRPPFEQVFESVFKGNIPGIRVVGL